jgi:signal peptidase
MAGGNDPVSTLTGSTSASAVGTRGRRRTEGASKLPETPTTAFLAVAGRTVFTVVLVLAALVFLFLAVGPRFLGYQTSTMLTGSMSPEINPGDVVLSVKTPVSELEVGDVITYSIPIDDRRVETHRVQSIKRDDAGRTSVTTAGDANPGPDPWTAVLSEDYVYTKAAVLPYLGNLIRAMRQPVVQSMLLYGGSALLVVILLTSIWGKSEKEPAPAAPIPDDMADAPDPDPDPVMKNDPAPQQERGV